MNHRSLPGELHDDDGRSSAAPPPHPRPRRRPRWRRPAGLLAAAALAALGCGAGSGGQPASAASQPAAMTPAQIAARATPAVVTIRGDGSLGAGFLVREDGWIA